VRATNALPLVKVYSRRQARHLFAGFETVAVSACCTEASHFPPPLARLLGCAARHSGAWLGFGGWYLLIRATKARSSVAPQ